MLPVSGGAASVCRLTGFPPRHDGETSPGLAAGTSLLGEYHGSGRRSTYFLIRRADGRMLEVSPLLYLVAANLDGDRPLADVARRVTAASGRNIPAEGVSYLIERKLQPLGVLDRPMGVDPPSPAQRAPVLALSIRGGVVPASLVRHVAGLLRPLFLPPIVVVVLLSLVVVDVGVLGRHDAVAATRDLAFQPGLLLFVIGLTVVAGLFHEIGHATACRYGGAEPGAIGAGIYLLWPILYNDLNDTYRLPRSGRLRADLGGVYFNAIAIVILGIVFAATGFAPLLAVIALQHLAILHQFLPFVRLDGYYIVSDLAGVPDLFGRIRPTMARLMRRGHTTPASLDLSAPAQAMVTVWVIATVALLGAFGVLFLVRLPMFVSGTASAVGAQVRGIATALGARSPLAAVVGMVQVGVLTVPLVGVSSLVLRVVTQVHGRRRALRHW